MDMAKSPQKARWVKTIATITLTVVVAGALVGLVVASEKVLGPIVESKVEKRFESRVERFDWATPECFDRVFGPADGRRRWLARPENVQQTEGLLGLC